jgi:hypothetical protein
MSAVDYLFEQLWELPKDKLTWYAVLKEAKEIEENKNIKRQLFIGKVSEVLGCRETIKLLKECDKNINDK